MLTFQQEYLQLGWILCHPISEFLVELRLHLPYERKPFRRIKGFLSFKNNLMTMKIWIIPFTLVGVSDRVSLSLFKFKSANIFTKYFLISFFIQGLIVILLVLRKRFTQKFFFVFYSYPSLHFVIKGFSFNLNIFFW